MTASFFGHVDIVRMLTEATAQVNIQQEVHVHVHVYCSYHHKTHCTTCHHNVIAFGVDMRFTLWESAISNPHV